MLKKLILGTQVLFLIWVVLSVANADCSNSEYVGACQAGTGIGVLLIIFLWALVNIILLTIWFVTKKK